MPKISAYKCDMCGKLCTQAFTVTVECEGVKFSLGNVTDQPRLYLTVCADCIEGVGGVIRGALH